MKLLEQSFSHRRKSMINSLKVTNRDPKKMGAALEKIGKSTSCRAEELSPEEWEIVIKEYYA